MAHPAYPTCQPHRACTRFDFQVANGSFPPNPAIKVLPTQLVATLGGKLTLARHFKRIASTLSPPCVGQGLAACLVTALSSGYIPVA